MEQKCDKRECSSVCIIRKHLICTQKMERSWAAIKVRITNIRAITTNRGSHDQELYSIYTRSLRFLEKKE